MGRLEDLQVWQEALNFVETVYRDILPRLPKEEAFALKAQLQRAAQSIPANLAEGYGRHHLGEQIRFCYIARGSAEEVYTYLVLSRRLGYLSEDEYEVVLQALISLKRQINGYLRYLRRRKEQTNNQQPTTNNPYRGYHEHPSYPSC